MPLPLQSNCDPNDPEEHVLWATVGLPGPGKNAPLTVPPQTQREWSKHLYDCGFRHHPELQKIKYVPPPDEVSWIQGFAGMWVPIDTPLPPEVTAPDISGLSAGEEQVLWEKLEAKRNRHRGNVPEDTAEEGNG